MSPNAIVNAPGRTYSGGVTRNLAFGGAGSLSLSADAQYPSHVHGNALNQSQDRLLSQTFVDTGMDWTTSDPAIQGALTAKNVADSKKPVGVTCIPSTGVIYYNFGDRRPSCHR